MANRYLAILVIALGALLTSVIAPVTVHAISFTFSVGTSLNHGRSISCSQGERLLRNHGFRNIRRLDCYGRHFVYRGWRDGGQSEITVRSSNGRVVNVRRLQ